METDETWEKQAMQHVLTDGWKKLWKEANGREEVAELVRGKGLKQNKP